MSTSDTRTTASSEALARLRNPASGPANGSDPTDADMSGAATTAQAAAGGSAPAILPPGASPAPWNDAPPAGSKLGTVPAVPAGAEDAAPPTNPPLPEHVSERIAHPVPRRCEHPPAGVNELLHDANPSPQTGPSFRHLDQPVGPPFRHLDRQARTGARHDPAPQENAEPRQPAAASGVASADAVQAKAAQTDAARDGAAHSGSAQSTASQPRPSSEGTLRAAPTGPAAAGKPAPPVLAREAPAVAGGFAPINEWLDSLHGPDWQGIGAKLVAFPSQFKTRLGMARAERARAVEALERTRLRESAHAEALAEAAQRAEQAPEPSHPQSTWPRLPEHQHPEHLATAQQAPAQQPPAQLHRVQERVVAARKPADAQQLAALVASTKAAIDKQQALDEPIYVAPYALPDTSPNPAPTRRDMVRRVLFAVAAAFLAVAAIVATGDLVSGTIASQSPRLTLLSLAPAAHALWPVVLGWVLAAALYTWVPSQQSAVRQRAVGRTFPAALASAGLWLISARAEWLVVAFCAAALAAVLLLATVRELNKHTARTTMERLLTDAPMELMSGFFLVLFASSLSALLHSWGWTALPVPFACLAVLALGYVALGLSRTERGRILVAIGFGWGMIWLLVPRLLGSDHSFWVVATASLTGFVVLLATENRRYQINHAEHRAARGKSTEF